MWATGKCRRSHVWVSHHSSSSMQRMVHSGSYVQKNLFIVPLDEIGAIKYQDRDIGESRILSLLCILIFPYALS